MHTCGKQVQVSEASLIHELTKCVILCQQQKGEVLYIKPELGIVRQYEYHIRGKK